MRLGLIGAGAIGATHAEAAKCSDFLEIVAVCDELTTAATQFEARYGTRAYTSVPVMIGTEDLDGIIIATPPNSHRLIAEFAASRGLHVLCEKPLALDTISARAMFSIAYQHRVVLSMASKFRFVEDIRSARRLAGEGQLGEILLVENAFTSSLDMSTRWNSNPDISGGGVIVDNGTHALDMFRYLLGPVHEVRAQEARRYQRLAVEDTATLTVRTRSGALATSDLSWSIDKVLGYFLRIHGSDATLEIGWSCSRMRFRSDRDWHVIGEGYKKLESFSKLQRNFANAILGLEPAEVSPADAIASVEAVESAYASLASDSWVAVGSSPRRIGRRRAVVAR
ncbi:MAG: Gfo/Idh/MocA family protein [Vulcanimicrobiaceae bacterium]